MDTQIDSRLTFRAGNYGITTMSVIEFWFVVDPLGQKTSLQAELRICYEKMVAMDAEAKRTPYKRGDESFPQATFQS